MATPAIKLFNPTGEYVAAFRYAEDAACVLALYGDGAQARWGHSPKDTFWIEGVTGKAADSYDAVANALEKLREEYRRLAEQKTGLPQPHLRAPKKE